MAKNINIAATLSLLIDTVNQGSIGVEFASAYTIIDRQIVTVAQSAVEASFLAASISQIDFVLIKPVGDSIVVRLKAAGTQISIPTGGVLMVMENTVDIDDILIAGGAADDAEVEIIVAEI